jgi:hypothetical protein
MANNVFLPQTHQIVTPDVFQEVLDFINDHFINDQPLWNSFGCKMQSKAYDDLLISYMKQGLSLYARDMKTGIMIGSSIIFEQPIDATLPTNEELLERGFSKEVVSIFNLQRNVLDTKRLMLDYNEKKMLIWFIGCVHRDYRNIYIATEHSKRFLEYMAKVGCTFIGAICTSRFSQKILEGLEFDKVKEIKYESYIDPVTNTRLFKDVEYPHKSAIGYVKKL